MNIILQYFDSCPGWKVVDERVKDIIEERGLHASLEYQRIETPQDAEKYQFVGSPTLLIDERDPFATGSMPVGLVCRTYMTDAGVAPSPSVQQLEKALGV
jgi:hypothetical protein